MASANINVTLTLNTTPHYGRRVVIATDYRMAVWAANQLGIFGPNFTFVSTAGTSHSLRGLRLTMDDLIFAPGYRRGERVREIERELRFCGVDLPDGQVVDFGDSR